MTDDISVPWCGWTPAGYITVDLPAPFVRAWQRSDDDDRSMLAVGYDECAVEFKDTSNYGVRCWSHPGNQTDAPHLIVELWDVHQMLAIMVVPGEHRAPFFFEKLPDLLAKQRAVDDVPLTKAILAFIRHGHGVTTIDKWGAEDKEERELRLERQYRARQDERKRKDAAASVAKAMPA